MSGNIVKYGSYDVEEAVKEKEELEKANRKFFEWKEGDNYVRFLPPPVGKKTPFQTVWMHYIDLPGDKSARFACPKSNANQPCIVCVKADQYKSTGNTKDFEKAKKLFAKRRVFANIIDRSDPDKGVQVAAFGISIHEALAKIRKDEVAGGDFCNPTAEGFDIVVNRTGKTKNDTEYTVLPARKPSPLGNMEWISQQHDLTRIEPIPTTEEIKEMLGVGGDSKSQEREINGKSQERQPPPAKPRRAQDDIEDAQPVAGDENDLPF